MQVDSYFSIGSSHSVCEDYALHGVVNERPFAVLSDGCSSSRYTDFGSRFLCLAAQEVIRTSPQQTFLQNSVLPYACSLMGTILPWECLDATVMAVYASQFSLITQVVGDGVIVGRRRDGVFHVREIEFTNNAPGYLTYLLDSDRHAAFKAGTPETEGGIRKVTESLWAPHFRELIKEPVEVTTEVISAQPSSFWYFAAYPRQEWDLIAAFSDGACSFQRRAETGSLGTVLLPEVLQQLMHFKQLKGEFVKRRCKRFLQKFCVENAWSHYDDFSCIALYNDEEVQK